MSKPPFDLDPTDRIPTYEEAVAVSTKAAAAASSSSPGSRQRTASSSTSSIRQQRTRRIYELVVESLIPCFATHVSNLCNHLTIIVVPADNNLRATRTLTEQNVVSPSLPSHQTTGVVITLSGTENHSSFWTQQAVVEELDLLLRRELSNPSASAAESETQSESLNEKSQPPQSQLPPPPQFQVQPAPETQLPPRPTKSSWFKRAFALPGPDHDPTGETGKWNLGWRSPEQSSESSIGDSSNSTSKRREGSNRTLQTDEVAVQTRLHDVSFRTENDMGLLETTTVKCIWIEIEVGL
ncbi:uncharacterized protein Z520_11180 [Fonsecaea multimorphosa CBS 102226]|uniref:Uncharacterized protein n=1 Tax=Fonsecaea multimorphosa CBS 102226 TaxID=1442371 RepID=A0A0D2K9Q3_9EURO|nr:uncharacterized protein Z520_11180 [Fonsecaea multimorphosa CBS 102226]KIX93123.1 hypothetical protein Z520_11180 [Fonsecaea multimorphosa CBS 102226]OAL18325.1 hypothetical protein AYO22_10741 [Fonsecaea multimorphosa]